MQFMFLHHLQVYGYLLNVLVVTGLIFVLGYIFWKMGAWAGGDVKLFTGLAALIPFYAIPLYPSIVSYQILGQQFPC